MAKGKNAERKCYLKIFPWACSEELYDCHRQDGELSEMIF